MESWTFFQVAIGVSRFMTPTLTLVLMGTRKQDIR